VAQWHSGLLTNDTVADRQLCILGVFLRQRHSLRHMHRRRDTQDYFQTRLRHWENFWVWDKTQHDMSWDSLKTRHWWPHRVYRWYWQCVAVFRLIIVRLRLRQDTTGHVLRQSRQCVVTVCCCIQANHRETVHAKLKQMFDDIVNTMDNTYRTFREDGREVYVCLSVCMFVSWLNMHLLAFEHAIQIY